MVKWINTKQTVSIDGKECVVYCNEKDPNDKRIRKFKTVDGKKKATYKKISSPTKKGGSLIAIVAIYPVVAIIVFIIVLLICKAVNGEGCGSEAFKYGLLWPFALIMILIDASNRSGGRRNAQLYGGTPPHEPSDKDFEKMSIFAKQLYECSTNYISNASTQDELLQRLSILHAIFTSAKLDKHIKAINLSSEINISDLKSKTTDKTFIELPIDQTKYIYYFNKWQSDLGITKKPGQNFNDIRTDYIPEVYGEKSFFVGKPALIPRFKTEMQAFYTEIKSFISRLESFKSAADIKMAFYNQNQGVLLNIDEIEKSLQKVNEAATEVLKPRE
jgi:hypothetical protein